MLGANRITKTINQQSFFEDCSEVISAATSFNQGDLLVLKSNLLRKVTTGDTGSDFCGIARETVVLGQLPSVYTTDVDASTAKSSVAGPVFGVEVDLVLKTADAINPGDAVYLDGASGAYHVTSTIGGSIAIGAYQGPAIASATAGQTIKVHIGGTLGGSLQM